jgi:hypothetical protein
VICDVNVGVRAMCIYLDAEIIGSATSSNLALKSEEKRWGDGRGRHLHGCGLDAGRSRHVTARFRCPRVRPAWKLLPSISIRTSRHRAPTIAPQSYAVLRPNSDDLRQSTLPTQIPGLGHTPLLPQCHKPSARYISMPQGTSATSKPLTQSPDASCLQPSMAPHRRRR